MAAPLAAVLIVLYWHNKGMTQGADFVLRVITASGVFFAVIVALFGDRLRTVVNRIRLTIGECSEADNF